MQEELVAEASKYLTFEAEQGPHGELQLILDEEPQSPMVKLLTSVSLLSDLFLPRHRLHSFHSFLSAPCLLLTTFRKGVSTDVRIPVSLS